MKTIMDFVMPNNGIASRADLYTSKCITIDVIILYQPSTISKYVDATLMTVVYLIFPE